MLYPRYTFKNFAVAGHNQAAVAAARAFASSAAQPPMAFFLSAGPGLGKTHLMNAMGDALYENYDGVRVGCVSAEYFANDFQRAADGAALPAFRRRYREFDALLVDDVDRVGGGTFAQEELLGTCTNLLEASKRIVFTSRRSLSEVPALGEALSSQVGAGTLASISAPDSEARVAFLRAMARTKGIELDQWVADCLAKPTTVNIRRLEGALVSLARRASDAGKSINDLDGDFIRDFVRDSLAPSP
jgi:chromosomal replication initiator protein